MSYGHITSRTPTILGGYTTRNMQHWTAWETHKARMLAEGHLV
jgi:hypothetical protein